MAAVGRIAIVEDEADLAVLLAYNLQRAGYEVRTANDGRAGLSLVLDWIPDLVVLDIMLPHISGIDVARQIRTHPKTAGVAVMVLTAKSEERDQLAGLKVGADDYITKPFSMNILLARVETLLRRARGGPADRPGDVVELDGIRADLSTHQVTAEGQQVRMTLTEFRILTALMRGRGSVLSRADLMYTAMGPDVMVTARTIDVHVAAIRRKLGRGGSMIRTVRGVGYLMQSADRGRGGDR